MEIQRNMLTNMDREFMQLKKIRNILTDTTVAFKALMKKYHIKSFSFPMKLAANKN